MPIYEYKCRECGHRFEYLVLRTAPAAACPACQAGDLEQLISAFGMSSEGTRQTNLASAEKKAGRGYKDKQREEHKQLHNHFDH